MNFMNLFNKKKKLSKEEKERIKNEKELEEYNRREEKYNDMLRDETQKQKFRNKMNRIKINTFTKTMVAIIIGVCIIDLQLTYVLAFMDKMQTIEGLSTQLCITILGVAFVYMIRAYFDSKAEHKNLDNQIKDELKEDLSNKINNIFNAAGVNIDANEFLKDDEDDPTTSGGLHININANKNNDDNNNAVG